LNIAGVQIPEGVQGQPFDKANHPIVSEVRRFPEAAERFPERYDQDLEAIIPIEDPQLKLIKSTKGRTELYNRVEDPDELYDIKDDIKKREILQKLNHYLLGLNPIRQKYEALKKTPKKLDEATKERLRALGYIR